MNLLQVAAGCIVQVVSTDLTVLNDVVVEENRVEVGADPSCEWVQINLPADSQFQWKKGKIKLGDATRSRFEAAHRVQALPKSATGEGAVVVHLPELVTGDLAVLQFSRIHHSKTSWVPGPAKFVEIRGAVNTHPLEPNKHGAWSADVGAEFEISPEGLSAVWPESGRTWGERAAKPTLAYKRTELLIPSGDPQISLFPGGGSSAKITKTFSLQASTEPTALVVSATDVLLQTSPKNIAKSFEFDGNTFIEISGGQGARTLTVVYSKVDAPTYGLKSAESEDIVVDGGEVVWEGNSWRLVSYKQRAILPNRSGLLKALDYRFRGSALPEPALPMNLRGRLPDSSLAADLRPTLRTKISSAPWVEFSLHPRKLQHTKKTHTASELESMLLLWVYARQAGLDAHWGLARPNTLLGEPALHSPAGYTKPVLFVLVDGKPHWIAPSCEGCGPFELPVALQGAAVMGPNLPDLTGEGDPGSVNCDVIAPQTTYCSLSGNAAMAFRTALSAWLPSERLQHVEEIVGGTLSNLRGIDSFSEPISFQATTTFSPFLPTALWPHPMRPGHTRTYRRPAASGDLSFEVACDDVELKRTVSSGVTSTTATYLDSSPDVAACLSTATAPPPPAQPAVETCEEMLSRDGEPCPDLPSP